MSTKCPLIAKKINVLGRVEEVPGTIETLGIADGKIRIKAGALPEYVAPREDRDIARATLTSLGSLESTKALNVTFRTEANTRDIIPNLVSLDIESIEFQSAIAGGTGSIQRHTFNSTPDLSAIVKGDYLDSNYCTNSSNDGTFLIIAVNVGSFYVDVVNRVREDNSDDEAILSPGIGDIQNVMENQWAMNSSGAKVTGATRVAIGAVTVASFLRNEVVNAGGGKTGRVVIPAEDGDAYIFIQPTGAQIESADVLVGATSGATATASADATINGHYVRPVSGDNCDFEVASITFQNDGYEWKARSSVANMSFEAAANKAMFLDYAFQGPSSSNGDAVLLKPVRDNEDPPIVKTAELKLDNYLPVFSQCNFDMANVIALRENGNALDDSGFESARVTARKPKVTVNLEMDTADNFDFFDKYDSGSKIALQMHAGVVLEKQVWFFADYWELDGLPIGEKDGITSLEVSGMCTGLANGADDEWEMAFV